MARITIKELVAIIKASPDYRDKWELEVPAEQALYIRFATGEVERVESDVLEVVDGSELVIDRDPSGKIVGIEIV